MKKQLLLLGLICIQHLLNAQSHNYQIKIEGHRAGSFSQSIERNEDIHTFTQLDFQVLTIKDTIRYYTRAHFVESDSGLLKSVEWTQISRDTIIHTVVMKQDSIYRTGSGNFQYSEHSPSLLLGPKKVKTMSVQLLDSIGSEFSYKTFSIELNKPVTVHRKLVGFVVEKAQRLNLIYESIDGVESGTAKYDKNFNLVYSAQSSPFGEILLTKVDQLVGPQFFNEHFFIKSRLTSNIRFPDPNNINAIKVKISGIDSLSKQALQRGNQEVIDWDSTSAIISVNNKLQSSTSTNLKSIEFLWSNELTKSIIDSLALNNLSTDEAIAKIQTYCQTLDKYATIGLYQLSLAAGLRSRFVYGYAYNQWFWVPKIWIEIVSQNRWQVYEENAENHQNIALRIALFTSNPGDNLAELNLAPLSTVSNIHVLGFELFGQKHSFSNQVLPYYFEDPVYENEGLGLRFNLPSGFEITDDGTLSPSPTFLTLGNKFQESISFSQILTQSEIGVEEEARRKIARYIGQSEVGPSYNKKLNFWYSSSENRGAIAIIQGNSLIFITINHQDPEFIIQLLTRKNLHLKY